jgi:NCAIR mutase (PurE)-related protein
VNPERLRSILARVASGELSAEAALAEMKHLPFEDLGFARVDHHRALRVGFPEVIFGQGKTAEQIVAIAERLRDAGSNVLVTRLEPGAAAELTARLKSHGPRR